MPSRGYRKGISDSKAPLAQFVRSRLTSDEYSWLSAEADNRSITLSKLIRIILAAHLKGQRAELPHPRAIPAAALRELNRTGNNLNQLAKQANTGMVPVNAAELRAVLASVLDAVRRLV
jgi:hypothetical protein